MNLLERLRQSILERFPAVESERSLLAVSGGLDSVAMAHLFATFDWSFGIAHCNFQLRGAASVADQQFVQELAAYLNVPFYTIDFDAQAVARQQGISIQMAARQLRYDWLERMRQEHGYAAVATAHHLNDSIETTLLQQIRGTGWRGLLGIPPRRDRVFRPLGGITREELETFARAQQMAYREDSSNEKDGYHRNRIRHHVLPVLSAINPALEQTYLHNFRIWTESFHLFEWAVDELKRRYVRSRGQQLEVDYGFLQAHPQAGLTLLYEWLRDCHFHQDQLQQAIEAVGDRSGPVWYSESHRLLVDRNCFVVAPVASSDAPSTIQLETVGAAVRLDSGVLSSWSAAKSRPAISQTDEWSAQLDLDKVQFPLTIRRWQAGDAFCPLGMQGRRKKLQDFFTDAKLSRFDKERVWLVTSANGDIIWVVGHRIDERYKLRDDTRLILHLRYDVK